jgi:hypothetical protein
MNPWELLFWVSIATNVATCALVLALLSDAARRR